MPNYNLIGKSAFDAYRTHKVKGAIIDDPIMRIDERNKARYEKDKVLAGCEYPIFEQADLAAIVGSSKGKLCTPWQYYLKWDPLALFGAQLLGDCVSWGARTASDITRIPRILEGKDEYKKRQATALLYSLRGWLQDGAFPSRVSKGHVETGFLLEEKLTDEDGKVWDFQKYRDYYMVGKRYGKTGLPKSVTNITKQHRVKHTSMVSDMDALADAIYNYYGAHCGSNIGVHNVGDPLSVLRGSWAHDMAIVGFDDTREFFPFRVWFWDQSWGDWNKIRNIPKPWQPWGQGMFALSENDTWRAIRQRDTWIFSDADGFPARPFDYMLI